MLQKEGYIPKDQRKKILLITDDIRVHSGVAQIGREMILNTCHRYNWTQIAGAISHPEKGKHLDISADTNKHAGIEDSLVTLYPTDGYGDPDLLRKIIKLEKPDALFLITDPRYFTWLFQMENEIRKTMPIVYLNIWDSVPAPQYNREFYESCDLLLGISKQTKFINKNVLEAGGIPVIDLDIPNGNIPKNKTRSNPILLKYLPHGLDNNIFKPLPEDDIDLIGFKKHLFKEKEYDFVLLFNSRNIRRKSIPDTILAWRMFIDQLPKEKTQKCLLVLHTQPVDENGTDLPAVIEYYFPEDDGIDIMISDGKLSSPQMNMLYNCADGVILLSSNEGWGLSLTEALLTGTPIIANVTGGMQDQMRFVDNDENWYTNNSDVPSNHKKTYTKSGEWAFPVFPSNLSLVGSVFTPYIYDDRCTSEDATKQIMELYNLSREERKLRGLAGLEWATGDEAGFTSEKMSKRIIEGIDILFNTWKPREKYQFITDKDYKQRKLEHKVLY